MNINKEELDAINKYLTSVVNKCNDMIKAGASGDDVESELDKIELICGIFLGDD